MSKFVLVAEDDPDILSLVLAVLEEEGFRVGSTAGADTLAEVERNRPDIVLLDYQMPGMDGIEIARRLKANSATADIPIIAMTAAGRAAFVCREMDASGCLGKPFDIDELVSVVDQMVHTAH
ncbi:MAG: response regulator [Chloroflexota bacterium]|nr:MAG: response regulator [Chloroflexota bacterium]